MGEKPRAEHPASEPIDALLKSCEAQRFRASGPGGQHRNKVQTAVRLTHRPTGITGQASERRSQAQNHTMAVFRLRVNLALSVRPAPGNAPGSGPECASENDAGSGSIPVGHREDVPAMASGLWRSRVRGGRLSINPGHDDFPSLLAEALDHLAWRGHDVLATARALGVSPSQLLKLLRLEPRALEQVNAARAAAGLPGLR